MSNRINLTMVKGKSTKNKTVYNEESANIDTSKSLEAILTVPAIYITTNKLVEAFGDIPARIELVIDKEKNIGW